MNELNYIDDIAVAIHRVAEPAADPLEDLDLYRHYALLCLVNGTQTNDEDVHDAYSVWAAEHDPARPSLVPYAELPSRVQVMDAPYSAAIRAVARTRNLPVEQMRARLEGQRRYIREREIARLTARAAELEAEVAALHTAQQETEWRPELDCPLDVEVEVLRRGRRTAAGWVWVARPCWRPLVLAAHVPRPMEE